MKEQALQAITLNGAKILALMIVPVRLKKRKVRTSF
jgi:hypothetical protein